VEFENLWKEFKEKKSKSAREKLIMEYLPLVKYIAYRMAINFPSHIMVEDIINDGLVGLIQAIDGFKLERGIDFKTYATFRVKGAILDALRTFDWAPRSLRKKARELEDALVSLEHQLGRPATSEEVASYLSMDLKQLEKVLDKIQGLAIISLDDFISSDTEETKVIDMYYDKEQLLPEGLIEKKELIVMLGKFINELPYKEKLVITLYYYEELNLKEIASVMELTESRISQLHTKALFRVKGKLKEYFQPDIYVTSKGKTKEYV
jgi:RNA polymerase sigma factor for flagellar operon FliA